jgi:hypothetical protein
MTNQTNQVSNIVVENDATKIISSYNLGQGNPVTPSTGKTPLLECYSIDVESMSINDITLSPAQLLAFTAFHTWKGNNYQKDNITLFNLSEHNALTVSHLQKLQSGNNAQVKTLSPIAGHVLTSVEYKANKLRLLDDVALAGLYDALMLSTAKGIVAAFDVVSLDDRQAIINLEAKELAEKTKFDKLVGFKDIKTLTNGSYIVTLAMADIASIALIPANSFELVSTTPSPDGFIVTFKDKVTV